MFGKKKADEAKQPEDEQQNLSPEEKVIDVADTNIQNDMDSSEKEEASQNSGEASPEPAQGEILFTLQDIGRKVESLETTFREKLMRTVQEEKILDSMHEELQKYRADLYANLLRPVLSELCNICDSILRNKVFYEEKAKENGEIEPTVPLKLLVDYAYELQDLLKNNDILIYRTEPGMAFNPARHRVIKKVKIDKSELHGKIAESHSAGYLYCGKTLSPEKVSVYYFEKPKEEDEKPEGGEK